jgi:hypothetical protein
MSKTPTRSLAATPGRSAAWRLLAACLFIGLIANVPAADAAAEAEASVGGRTYFVDSQAGQDHHDGLTPERAWRSIHRVNAAELAPGDIIRFRRGGQWRGSLIPVSGSPAAPVTYTSYGSGPKPRILGSLARNRPEDWVQVRENLWATLPQQYQRGQQLRDLRNSVWRRHQEAGARVELRVVPDAAGRSSNWSVRKAARHRIISKFGGRSWLCSRAIGCC